MKIVKRGGWVYYVADTKDFNNDKVGKWMYFFSDKSFVENLCRDAVSNGIVAESKHTDNVEGVSCFYLNCDDVEAHKRIIGANCNNKLN